MPPWDAVWDLLRNAILPAFAAAAIITAAVAYLGGAKMARTGAALGLIVGVAFGFWLKHTLPLVPGDSTWNRLPWAALIALAVGRIAHLADGQASDGWILRVVASFGIAWWVVPEMVRADFIVDQIAGRELPENLRFSWIIPAFAIVIAANWVLLEVLGNQPANASIGVCLVLALCVTGGVLVFAGIARYMEAALIVAMAVAGITAIAGWRQLQIASVPFMNHFEIGAVMSAIAVALPGLLLVGNRETSVESIHWAAFALPALAPLLLFATIPCRDWPKGRMFALRVGLVLIPLIIAMILARQGGSLDFGDHDW